MLTEVLADNFHSIHFCLLPKQHSVVRLDDTVGPQTLWYQELLAVQELLIQYLSSGQGYDDESVSLALQEGNQLFQQKDFSRACDFFGIAYEIGRHHYCYRPLLHDLLLRRALCHSLLGNFKVAQQEIEKALWLIPHEATGLLVAALVYSKLGLVTEANVSFQQAVCSQRELKDLVDCLVAFFCLQHHYADRAVNICTQVLQRSPKCPLALLMRGDAYRFGAEGREEAESGPESAGARDEAVVG
ncbi:unnamed protein product [Durusdinium trenchii]|uniref:Uncharacterized protein n=1 Tax=Durusdinium trenchii TaxID=1381693 RepID=A0ABP0I7X9_9DINO